MKKKKSYVYPTITLPKGIYAEIKAEAKTFKIDPSDHLGATFESLQLAASTRDEKYKKDMLEKNNEIRGLHEKLYQRNKDYLEEVSKRCKERCSIKIRGYVATAVAASLIALICIGILILT